MKSLVVSGYQSPEPVAIQTTLAVELARQGHREMVVTGFPYPPSRVIDAVLTLGWGASTRGSPE
jgi:hypothetical protein